VFNAELLPWSAKAQELVKTSVAVAVLLPMPPWVLRRAVLVGSGGFAI
jgi:hypothetical protein